MIAYYDEKNTTNFSFTSAVKIATDFYITPFKPEFTIVLFIHYKPRIAVAIFNL